MRDILGAVRLRRSVALLALLLIGGLLLGTTQALHAATNPRTDTFAPAVVTPVAQPAAPFIPDAASARPYAIGNPFPSTQTMTDTVLAAVTDVNTLPQPLRAPQGVFLPQPTFAGVQPEATLRYKVFVPTAMVRAKAATTPTPPPPPPPGNPADVAVTIWPTPSIRVARNGTLAYELRIANYGQGTATKVQVTLPYNRQQVTLYGSAFAPGSGDWISAIGDNTITVTFGPIAAGAKRTATVYERVAPTLPDNTVINIRPSYTWSDHQAGGSGSGNWAPVLVGGGNDTSAYLWLRVDPASGRVGTVHHFFTDRLIPGEGVITWLNTPSGVRPLSLRGVADMYGRVWLDFSSTGLPPGNYSLVVYGARSNLTGVGGFVVQP